MITQFLSRFKRYIPTEYQRNSLLSLCEFSLRIDKENKSVFCDAVFSDYVEFERLSEIEDSIRQAYEINCFRFFPSYKNTSFTVSCFSSLVFMLNKHYISAIGKAFLCEYTSALKAEDNGNVLEITLKDGLEASLLYDSKVDRFFEDAVLNQFGTKLAVRFIGEALPDFESERSKKLRIESQEAYLRQLEARQKATSPAGEGCDIRSLSPLETEQLMTCDKETPDIITVGRLTFDISEKTKIYGNDAFFKLCPIRSISANKRVSFLCKMFQLEDKESRDGERTNYRMYVTDLDSSIMVRFSIPTDQPVSLPKAPAYLFISGTASIDKFDGEMVVRAGSIFAVKRVWDTDHAKNKRVELHLHTNMSASDALTSPGEVMALASKWGMPAVAFTDHGNVQSYPEVMKVMKKYPDVKPIFGMEGYLVDDTARAVFGKIPVDMTFANGRFIVFDIETTGLSPQTCGITEIGAVRFEAGEVTDVFDTFVNPGMPIPENIVNLTGITDQMVASAPVPAEAVKSFLEFAGDSMLVAHNANFDISFIRKVASESKQRFDNPYLDTVSLSKHLNRSLSKHNLDAVRKHYGLPDFNHHRAVDDCRMLADIFLCMIKQMEPDGVLTVGDMINEMAAKTDPRKLKTHHVSILVQNAKGLKNLYKLISFSYLDYFYRFPRIPKTVLKHYREGLIIGSACAAGELYGLVLEGRPAAEQYKAADFYDYFEIMPHCNNRFLLDEGRISSNEGLEKINRRIIEIADKQKKPVVATGDVHFLEKEDEIYRQILQTGLKYSDADKETKLYFKSTEEMLGEFAYLGDRAEEIVVTNTRKIADMIEAGIKPIPDGTYTPEIEGAEDELISCCYEKAHEMYGEVLPQIVEERAKKELDSVITHGYAVLYVIARKLVQNSEAHGYLVGSRGSVGSSFIATLCGVSEVNPLPPHYRCPNCKKSIFFTDGSVGSGFDLDDRVCECGTKMIVDGHDIPFETFLGFKGDKAPDIDLNFSGRNQSDAHKYTEVLFGKENIFRAGTVGTIASKTAYGYVKKYLDDKGINLTKAEINRLTCGCVGIKRTTGQHPGGIVVIPKQYEIYDFTPVQHPADKESSGVITTHFAFEYLHDTLLKLDILGHDVPTIYKVLEEYTGIDVRTVPMNDKKVFSLFASPAALGASAEQIGCDTGTFGLPEFGTSYVRQMMLTAQPKNFSDLMQISGLSHGTGIWLNNGEQLIKDGICTIDSVIGTRDSIMLYLLQKKLPPTYAFKIMESVRKGKGLTEEFENVMVENNVPEWYIKSCKKIKYMFPKAHAAAYVISALRLGWYKVYYPIEFYATYFTAKPSGFDASLALQPKNKIVNLIKQLSESNELSQKEEETLVALQMVNEMYARGIDFLQVDVYKSKPFAFVPEKGKIRLPLIALSGLGETAADKIHDAITSGKATTLEELKTVAALSKTVVEILQSNNCLGALPDSNQLSLF